LSLNNESITQMLEGFEKDSKAIRKNLLKMCWYMRGGITYDEAIMLSHEERKFISEIIEENLETTEKTKLPFF